MGKNIADDLELREMLIVLIGVFIMFLVVPAIALLFFGGIEHGEYYEKVVFYYAFGGIALTILVVFGIAEVLTKAKITSFKITGWVRSLFFDSELSLLGQFGGRSLLTPSNIFNFSVILFGFMGIFAVATNTFFVAAPATTEFQVTETGDLLLSAEPAASSETLTFQVILALGFGLAFWLWKTGKVGFVGYVMLSILTIVINVIGWIMLHTARYGGSETAILAVTIFALIGGVLTWMTGSIIPWYVYHFFNNFYLRANELFSSDSIIFGIIVFFGMYSLIFLYFKLIRPFIADRS